MTKIFKFLKTLFESQRGDDMSGDPSADNSDTIDTPGDDAQSGDGMDMIAALPELQGKPDGHKCRVEIVVEKTADGIQITDAKYVAPVGGKSRDEYLNMSADERDKYDQNEVLGNNNQ